MQTLSLEGATRSIRNRRGRSSLSLRLYRDAAESAWRPRLLLIAEVFIAEIVYAFSVLLLPRAPSATWDRELSWLGLALAAVAALLATLVVGLYRRSLRHASLLDVRPLAATVALNCACLAIFLSWPVPWLDSIAPLLVLDAVLLFLSWGALHFGLRALRVQQASQRKHGSRAVIVGAGDAGLAVLKSVAFDPASPFRPIALVDDDVQKWGRTLFGVPVLGGTRDLAKIASSSRAEAILVCVPSATHSQMHHILDACRRLNLPVRSLPSLAELVQRPAHEKVSPRHLREPRIEYLLQRDEFRIDSHRTRGLVEGKTVLVTGAGGSIGSELAKQIATARPDKLLLLDKSENSLFYVNLEISEQLGAGHVKPILADLSGTGRADSILKSERPHLVFHAAAHKHVSMVELHPEEAIRNNVLGTRNLAEAAMKFGVGSFVNISTDKAVDPKNFMGLSKKLTELCIQEFAQQVSEEHLATRFSNVRFGNVAGSAGSVIRLFWDQIQRGGPIRVTDPHASRYFMAVSEAVHLILGAAELGNNGETFVFEMGEPFNIYELAKTMALFSGLRPHQDIAIEFTGLRKGEKLHEQLWDGWEHPASSSSRRILAIRERDPRSGEVLAAVREMERCLANDDSAGLMTCIADLFPRFGATREPVRPSQARFQKAPKRAVISPVEAA